MGCEGFHDLVQRAKGGDRKAMDQVLSILRPDIEKMAAPYADPVHPSESTSDLVLESCLRAWNKIGSFVGGEDDEQTHRMFRTWIGKIARHLGLTAKRDREGSKRHGPRFTVHWSDPNPPPPFNEILEMVTDEIDRQIFRLRYLERLGLTSIAERLDLAFHEVRRRYRALMARLEEELGGLE